MKISEMDVDDVLYEMLERVQRLEAPRAGRLIDETGMTYAQSCGSELEDGGACDSTERIFATVKLDDSDDVFDRWICAQCDALWIFAQGEIKIGQVQLPKSSGLEHERGEIERLSGALKLLDEWEERLYLQLFLWEDVRSRAEIAKIANKRWRSSRWTEWKVRQAISSAQKKIFRELHLKRRVGTMTLEDHKPGRGKRL